MSQSMAFHRETVAGEWRERGFTCSDWSDPPGREWSDFVHRVDEIILVLEGEIELEIEGRTLRPAIGEEVFVPAGAVHTLRNVGIHPSRLLYGYKTGK